MLARTVVNRRVGGAADSAGRSPAKGDSAGDDAVGECRYVGPVGGVDAGGQAVATTLGFSKLRRRSEFGVTTGRRCHNVVTRGCESGELAGDVMRLFWLVTML